MVVSGAVRITQIADLHIKIRINNHARLHLHIPGKFELIDRFKPELLDLRYGRG